MLSWRHKTLALTNTDVVDARYGSKGLKHLHALLESTQAWSFYIVLCIQKLRSHEGGGQNDSVRLLNAKNTLQNQDVIVLWFKAQFCEFKNAISLLLQSSN